MVTGQRLLYNYMRFSGVSQDIPTEFLPALDRFLKVMPGYLDEYDRMLADNEIFMRPSQKA
jgi:NADH-quinone oxidoreductase subunit D